MKVSNEKLLEMYRKMVLIRVAEQKLVSLFQRGKIPGFIHSYVGEEAVATGVCSALACNDLIASTHRGHGHILAKGCDLDLFFAELYGKAAGYCKGKGGSMHIANSELGIIGANGIVGGGISIAAGAALSSKIKNDGRVSVAFMGDGATATGCFHESLNLAALWDLPVVFVVENNGFTEFLPTAELQKIDTIADRAKSYGMEGVTIDGNDVESVFNAFTVAAEKARSGGGPTLLECVTYRVRGHFEGDPQTYRDSQERDRWREKDPLKKAESLLLEREVIDSFGLDEILKESKKKVAAAADFANSADESSPQVALEDVYTDMVVEGWS